MKIITMGAHVFDVLVRPVGDIPAGQGGALVDEIDLAVGGPAGGTALTLAKLGASVRSAGAIGADVTGQVLTMLLDRAGVDTTMLVRLSDLPTSATVVLTREDGSHPSLHLLGANIGYTADHVDFDAVAAADFLHLGGPELLGPLAAQVLEHAKANGVFTSVDLIAPSEMASLDLIEPILPHVDVITPNDDQVLGFTGATDVTEGARMLCEAGVGLVVVTCGQDGALLVTSEGEERVPAFDVEATDTSGCGDAFSAGLLRGLALGRSNAEASRLGCAVAGMVAQGLGVDHRQFTLAEAEAFESTTPTRS